MKRKPRTDGIANAIADICYPFAIRPLSLERSHPFLPYQFLVYMVLFIAFAPKIKRMSYSLLLGAIRVHQTLNNIGRLLVVCSDKNKCKVSATKKKFTLHSFQHNFIKKFNKFNINSIKEFLCEVYFSTVK